MRLGESKARELLERIVKDLSRKCNVKLAVEKRTKNLVLLNGHVVDSMYIAIVRPSEHGVSFTPLMYITGKVTYAKLLNRLVKFGIMKPYSMPAERIDINKEYGSTYEQMMMTLDINEVE